MKPEKSTDHITWKSTKKSVATVDNNGVVIARKPGKTEIIAKTSSGKKAVCKITVTLAAQKVEVSGAGSVSVGKTVKLKVKLTPSNSTDKLTWKSSNKKIAKVSKNGTVKGMKKGKAIITVKTSSGRSASHRMIVK